MKFALIDNIRTEATKGAKGLCPICGSDVISKCGDVKLHHWAHKSIRNCDPWWENETEWHREWKNNFNSDWQEIILRDEVSGEKHIADVQTSYGLVIEFQHSHIDPIERSSREQFYKKMFWVVDGTRLKRDYPRFIAAKGNFRLTNKKGYFVVDSPHKCFPSSWVDSSCPVIFDFKGNEEIKYAYDERYPLYCLLPKINEMQSIVIISSRESLIKIIISGEIFAMGGK